MRFPARKGLREGDVFAGTVAFGGRGSSSAANVPFVGHVGVIVVPRRGEDGRAEQIAQLDGVTGRWSMESSRGRAWSWTAIFVEDDVATRAVAIHDAVPHTADVVFDTPFALIDPLSYPWADTMRASDSRRPSHEFAAPPRQDLTCDARSCSGLTVSLHLRDLPDERQVLRSVQRRSLPEDVVPRLNLVVGYPSMPLRGSRCRAACGEVSPEATVDPDAEREVAIRGPLEVDPVPSGSARRIDMDCRQHHAEAVPRGNNPPTTCTSRVAIRLTPSTVSPNAGALRPRAGPRRDLVDLFP